MEKSVEKIKNIDSEFFKNPDRELSNTEYMNIREKSQRGTVPVDYFRQNLFNPTSTKEVATNQAFKKVIFEDEKLKITISNFLHQRHKDVLTALFIDNLGTTPPLKDGSYYIYTNLTHIAKLLGYSSPNSASNRIVELLDDLRLTDIKVFNKITKIEDSHTLLGESTFDTERGSYRVLIPAKTSHYHILNFAVEIPKEKSRLLLEIHFKYSKLKACITYMLSNTILKNGITLDVLMRKIGINVEAKTASALAKQKTLLKKEFIDNAEMLDKLGIFYDDISKKVFLKEQMNFIRGLTQNDIIKSYMKEGKIEVLDKKSSSYPKKDGDEWDDNKTMKDLLWFVNKYLRIEEFNYLVKNIELTASAIIIKTYFGGLEKDINIESDDFNGFEKEINTRTTNIDNVYAKLQTYNKRYLDFVNFTSEVEF